jgi:hypothetical protein
MPLDLTVLARKTEPKHTILLFGAGASIPSGAPSGAQMAKMLAEKLRLEDTSGLSLSDIATIAESKHGRRALIETVSAILAFVEPDRGVLNLPDFDWAGLYTTNFDEVVEKAYAKRRRSLQTISSNFDFGSTSDIGHRLYKLHGTVNADISLGQQHRMVLTATDYDLATDYRELVHNKFAEQLYSNDAVIVGQSLSDPDMKKVVEDAVRLKRHKGAPGQVTILSFERNDNQALVYEARGLHVCFGGVDEFLAELSKKLPDAQLLPGLSDDPLDRARVVVPSTINVSAARARQTGDLSRMFNGGPANYADIMRGWTFERDFAERIETQLASENGKRFAYVLGAAGCGKTSGVRKAMNRLVDRDVQCWEHAQDMAFPADGWIQIDDELRKRQQVGVLFIDDAHEHLNGINALVDALAKSQTPALKLVLVSSSPHWNPRLKSPAIFTHGQKYEVSSLSPREITSLLDIIESSPDVAALVEPQFRGFNRVERQRRLVERCRADMFVCMKNVFGSEAYDEIILQEYAGLSSDYQQVYKQISGMEAAGVRVHRQLVLRAIGIPADQVARYLADLTGIIDEQTVNEREGVFAWRVRHPVIAEILSKYKYSEEKEYYALLENVLDHLNPAYRIEVISLNEMCDPRRALGRIHDKRKQNVLLRRMISLAPKERVPRHRLITNLIALSEYETAATEIRLFENELRTDGPVQRYKVRLLLERAQRSSLLLEDRLTMIRSAANLADAGIQRFADDKNLYQVYLEAGVVLYKYGNDRGVFDAALQSARVAYERILDPDLARIIRRFEHVEQRIEALT